MVWMTTLSEVPQRSVLGPLLFCVYINDLDDGMLSKISKFADDTKISRKVTKREDVDEFRTDLNKLCKWSQEWQMLFNVNKCSVMHMGSRIRVVEYEFRGQVLNQSDLERDWGFPCTSMENQQNNVQKLLREQNRVLGMIKRAVVSREKSIILKLYKALVRPHLEYCIQVWNPHLKKDIETLERMQRRATRMIKGVGNLSYEERLRMCKLTNLEIRSRGDLIETFKILTGRFTT